MAFKIGELLAGGAPTLDNVHQWMGNPGIYAITMIIVFIVIFFLALALVDYISRWKLFFLASALAIIAIPSLTLLHSHCASKSAPDAMVGGYSAPPPAFMSPVEREQYVIPASYRSTPSRSEMSYREPSVAQSEQPIGTLSELFA